MDEMSLEVWNSAWARCMQIKRDILFLVTKVTWYFCFSQGVNSITGHASSILVLRKCFRGDENILIWKSSNIYNSKYRQQLFCSCCMQIGENFYFVVTKGNLTLVFHEGVNSISADESSPLFLTRCLLSLV